MSLKIQIKIEKKEIILKDAFGKIRKSTKQNLMSYSRRCVDIPCESEEMAYNLTKINKKTDRFHKNKKKRKKVILLCPKHWVMNTYKIPKIVLKMNNWKLVQKSNHFYFVDLDNGKKLTIRDLNRFYFKRGI